MIKKLRLPKVQMSIALIAIYLSAFGQLPIGQYVYVLVVALSASIISDLVISYIRVRKLFIPHAAMVTGMILTLLIDPTLAWYKIATIAFVAMAIKNFIRINNKHIFNPVSTGLLIGGYIFSSNVSWWGSSFQYSSSFNVQTLILYIILLSPLYISAYRMRRYYSIITFIISNAILTIASSGNFSPNTILIVLLNPTILFFSIVILPEPITSPSDRSKQIFFGVTVGILSFIIGSNFISGSFFIPDALIASLLVANLIFFKK